MDLKLVSTRGRLLDPIDRVSEILFGLIMAVTIVGSLAIATAGRNEVRTILLAALGCNLAWGLVDAVMYLIRTLTDRTLNRSLAERLIGSEPATAHRLIEQALPAEVRAVTGPTEIEAMRLRLLAQPVPRGAALGRDDYLAAAGIFLLVTLATFPVAVPFLLTDDFALAMRISRGITLVMLFIAGFVLGRHAGHHRPAMTGFWMMLLGAVLIAAVIALGG